MSQIGPNASTRAVSEAQIGTRTSKDNRRPAQSPDAKPKKPGPSSGGVKFSDVIREAQRDSRELDLQETVAASQTGRLMRSNVGRQKKSTYLPHADTEETKFAGGVTPVFPEEPLLDRPQDDGTTRKGQRKIGDVQTRIAKPETNSQKFARLTTSMNTISDVSRYVNVGVSSKIADILNNSLCIRRPHIERSLNEEQLVASMHLPG
ncbi:hypothetical protein [uncultured Roseibium sp.]|uniref:hypothetical protein n=1 Tax=uncultured Roseibium sp. TaxID=1936171 RepID=UPI00260AD739|nr:hypothetical protein [uncultured Roseibium sp.]